MKNLTRAERHELADLLESIRIYETEFHSRNPSPPEPDWAEVEAWTDRLREEAGPVEPTSYAARVASVALPKHVWARNPEDGLWYCLTGTRTDGISWDQLLSGYGGDIQIQILRDPQEG